MIMSRKDENGVWVVRSELAVNRYDFEGTVEQIKANLDDVRNKALTMGMIGEGHVDISVTRGYYGDDYDLDIVYTFNRLETDVERADREALGARLKAEAKAKRMLAVEAKKLKEDPEYAEFERLKAKFGG